MYNKDERDCGSDHPTGGQGSVAPVVGRSQVGAPAVEPESKRKPQLDGVRGLAIALVLVWHYYSCQIDPGLGGVNHYLLASTRLFWSGVDLFFVLSGFLISGILLDHRGSPNYFSVFYLRRACRILPIYVVTLVLYLIVRVVMDPANGAYAWLFADPLPFLSYATFTQNIFMGWTGKFGPNWLGITWSLAVEEQFYLAIPLLFYFIDRRTAVWILLMAITCAVLLRTASPGFHAFVNTPWRADSILTGALIAIAVRWEPFVAMVKQHRSSLYGLFGMFLVGAAVMTLRPQRFGELSSTWLALLYGLFLLIAYLGIGGLGGRLLGSRLLAWLGQISFAVYLFHQPINGLMHGLLLNDTPAIGGPLDGAVTVGALVLTLALATISFRYFESPILRYAHKFKYAQPKTTMGTR